MDGLFGENLREVVRKMGQSGEAFYVPVLIELFHFPLFQETQLIVASSIVELIGEEDGTVSPDRIDWAWWIEWLGNHPKVHPPEGFAAWKSELYSLHDPAIGEFFYEGVKTRIRLEEIVWGGVRKDGIPDLRNPPSISPEEATYLEPSDRVFGVSINGEHRAYPLLIVNAHEMANDLLGGVPLSLAY